MGSDSRSNSGINLALIKMIFKFIREKHPYAAPIMRDEAVSLIENLRKRLDIDASVLDLTPESLKALEAALKSYCKKISRDMPEEEQLLLLREIAAYVGEDLVQNTDGEWIQQDNSIWGTSLRYKGQWKILKENRKNSASQVTYTLVDISADSWQKLLDEKSPRLYSLYQNISKKELKEKSTYLK